MLKENRLIHYTNVIPPTSLGTGDVTTVEILDGTIVNADVDASAAIGATKIADGTVTDAEFQYMGGVTSDVQTQIDTKAPTASPTFTGTVTLPTGLTGVVRTDSGVVSVDADVTDIVTAASDSASGKVELATAAETTTGTDTARAITPDGLAGSDFGTKTVSIIVFDDSTDVSTGNGAGDVFYRIPSVLNGMNLVGVAMAVQTAGTTNNLDVQIHNVTQTADMLSTVMRIETGETDTSTSAQPGTIDTANDDVATGDIIRVDVDAVQTTAPKGLIVELQFQLP